MFCFGREIQYRTLIAWLLLALTVFALASAGRAQASEDKLLSEFDASANEARAELARPVGNYLPQSLANLDTLREKLAKQRDRAQSLANSGNLELRIVQAQIAALGPLPADGATEPAAMADQRKIYEERLGELMIPIMHWRESQARAATLVTEVDQRIGQLNRQKMMERATSPLDPGLWFAAIADIRDAISNAVQTTRRAIGQMSLVGILGRLLGAALLFVVGLYLVTKLGKMARKRIEKVISDSGSIAAMLCLALLQDIISAALFLIQSGVVIAIMAIVLLPIAGVVVVIPLATTLFIAGLLLAIGQWLGRSVLLAPIKELRLIQYNDDSARRLLNVVKLITLVLALETALEMVETSMAVAASVVHLASTALVIMGGALVWKLARLIKSSNREKPLHPIDANVADSVETRQAIDFAKPLAHILQFFAFATILTALAGYAILAREIYSNTLFSLATIAITIYLHRTIKLVLTALAAGPLRPYRRALHFLPMATGFVLLLAVLFIVALIWGYRLQEISDALIMVRNGVEFGDVRISAGDVFTFALVFVLGFVTTRWVQRFLRVSILPEFGMDPGAQSAILTGLGYIGILLAAVVAIATTGLDLSSLAFVAGALSVGLGFGLQSVVENFTSGILLLVERPIKEGDWIEVGEYSGIVRKIAVRSTQIETFDRHYIIIPNSQLITGSVKNLSFGSGPTRILVPIGVAYGSNLDHVSQLLLDIASHNPVVLPTPEPSVALTGFGDNSIDLKLTCHIPDVTTAAAIVSEINFEIAQRFKQENIEIPFPQRDLHIRSVPETLISKPV